MLSGSVASLTPEGQGSGAFGAPSSRLEGAVYVLALLGVLGGLVELGTLQAARHGWLGTMGFWAALVGTLLTLTDLAVGPLVEGGVFGQLLGPSLSGTLIGPALLGAGIVLLGVASLRATVLPRWCALALIVAPPVSGFLGSYGGGMALGLVWLALGGVLWMKGGEAT